MSIQKPLSPHLSIYRPQLTSILSILHRLSGVALVAGILPLCGWLFSIAAGLEQFEFINSLFNSQVGTVLIFIWSWAFFYHLNNGVRHFCWDIGIGLSLRASYISGIIVVISSIIFTLLLWGVVS